VRLRRRVVAAACAAALSALALPAAASADPWPQGGFFHGPALGMSEQDPAMFDSPDFKALGVRTARLVVGWDALETGWERAELDAWVHAADRDGVKVLLSLGHSRRRGREHVLPSRYEFRRQFLALRKRYPQVREYVAWNEANHRSQPTWRRPEKAAQYFDVMASACPRCTIVAADVLDWHGLGEWLQRFTAAAEHRPRIWGLHNYVDANRFQDASTRKMLRLVKGEVWFTETGGLVQRYQQRRPGVRARWVHHSVRRAARVTRYVFRLADLSPRVRRVYLYHWMPDPAGTWDSALVDERGRPRPAYSVVRNWLGVR
jgi:hypothetical protein